jgi:putative SOS response-associated peptidase YedK
MCGRFTVKATWAELVALYRMTMDAPPHNLRPRYNVCPTDPVDVVTAEEGKRDLVPMRWGLIPRWWSKTIKEAKIATFNARAATIETKPFFRDAFKRTRCLIPMSGYYEWQDAPGGKQPWYFTARDGSPLLTAAGLWDEWKDRNTGERLKSCTMIITEPNNFAAQRPYASVSDGNAIRAVAKRRGGGRHPEARSERLSATLASIEAGQ